MAMKAESAIVNAPHKIVQQPGTAIEYGCRRPHGEFERNHEAHGSAGARCAS
jgi:hypothetical protein